MHARGSLLGQIRPANTTATAIFTCVVPIEISLVVVCNTTGSAAAFRLFHDESGSTYDESNALYWDKSVSANDTLFIKPESIGSGFMLNKDDTLGIRTDTANALTITVYGVTAELAEPLNRNVFGVSNG